MIDEQDSTNCSEIYRKHPGEHEMINQCWFNVGSSLNQLNGSSVYYIHHCLPIVLKMILSLNKWVQVIVANLYHSTAWLLTPHCQVLACDI